MMSRYQAAVGARHLEIGVGTGYFPAHARFPVNDPEITLVDLNETSLDHTAKRIAHLAPRWVVADARQPLRLAGVPENHYDSVALNLVLHCIPGDLIKKGAVIANAAAALVPGGKLYGSTILSRGVKVPWAARKRMDACNRNKIFSNAEDSLDDLESVLQKHFTSFRLEVRGVVALFTAVK
jgi:ubiquinone/menaquinone biosynthesis C-methylase UbiE